MGAHTTKQIGTWKAVLLYDVILICLVGLCIYMRGEWTFYAGLAVGFFVGIFPGLFYDWWERNKRMKKFLIVRSLEDN